METLCQHAYLWIFLIYLIYSISLPNIALNKPAWQSSNFSSITAAGKAVDGLKSNLSWSSGQCAISAIGQTTAEWRVHLGNISSINYITIYYRTENYAWGNNGFRGSFLGFSVHVSNTTNKDDGHICFHDNGYYNLSTIPYVLTLNCTLHGRYVIYYNERIGQQPQEYSPYAEIDLCEIEVYGCEQGTFGENCLKKCPENCLHDLCELVTGNCFQCNAGYNGSSCDTECNGGMYGEDCGYTCGSCINNTQCQHINGSCLQGCGPGYQGDKCVEECPFGTYGNDCKDVCSATCVVSNRCNKTTGECVGGCKPGWKGSLCQQECSGGTYGQDCSETCGSCINDTQCQHINGSCLQGCGPGYQGDKCYDECDNGMYGLHCNSPCGSCINNTHCHHISGECPWGCTMGFQGIGCKEASHVGVTCDTCESYVIITVIIAIFAIIMGTIINIVIWRRNKKNFTNESHYENTAKRVTPENFTNESHYENTAKRVKPCTYIQGHDKQSTYSELGELTDIDKQSTYDDIHHYTNANYVQQ